MPSRFANPPPSKQAWRCLLLNLLVLPGLGTIKAGRLRSGYAQLLIGLVGFVVTVAAVVQVTLEWFHSLQEERPLALDENLVWWAAAGLIAFFASWFWALASSIDLVRHVAKDIPPELK